MSSLDEIMGFDVADMSIFQESTTTNVDERLYRTQPKLSKSEDGIYRSRIRVVYNPHNPKQSIIKLQTYWIEDANGGMTVPSSLSINDRNCPIFKGWKKLWYKGDEGSVEREESKARAKKLFDNTTSNYVLVQIIEDENQPELVGQFKFWKIPMVLLTKMLGKIKPTDPKKAADPIMDYLFGKILELEVQPGPDDPKNPLRKQRETSYSLSDFEADATPIIKIDGTQLFTDDELSTIEDFAAAKKKIQKMAEAKRKTELEKLNNSDQATAIRALYTKAIDYMKQAPDVEDMAYKPWDEATTQRVNAWLDAIDNGDTPGKKTDTATQAQAAFDDGEESDDSDPLSDDIPF